MSRPRTTNSIACTSRSSEIVLPQIGDSQGILFQRDPTFAAMWRISRRCCLGPRARLPGSPLLPLTRVRGSNSLYCESAPGVGDFEPFEGEFGLAHRFWGAACHHYTIANETEATRVSFDFRVVPLSCHAHNASRFELGGFYGWLTADGDVRMTAVPAAPHARVLACVRTGATASGQTELQDGDASNRSAQRRRRARCMGRADLARGAAARRAAVVFPRPARRGRRGAGQRANPSTGAGARSCAHTAPSYRSTCACGRPSTHSSTARPLRSARRYAIPQSPSISLFACI